MGAGLCPADDRVGAGDKAVWCDNPSFMVYGDRGKMLMYVSAVVCVLIMAYVCFTSWLLYKWITRHTGFRLPCRGCL